MASRSNAVRRATRAQRRATGPKSCRQCGCDLDGAVQNNRICVECAKGARGEKTTEHDHIVGKKIAPDLVVEVPANINQARAKREYAYPDLGESPVNWIVQFLCSLRDYCDLAQQILGRVIDWIIAWSHLSEDLMGPEWWRALPPLWKKDE